MRRCQYDGIDLGILQKIIEIVSKRNSIFIAERLRTLSMTRAAGCEVNFLALALYG